MAQDYEINSVVEGWRFKFIARVGKDVHFISLLAEAREKAQLNLEMRQLPAQNRRSL